MDYLPDFEVKSPDTIDAAIAMAADEGSAFLAGGTALMPNLRRGIGEPSTLIDLTAIPEMAEITETPEGLKVGAAVTLQQLLSDPRIQSQYSVIADAAETIAGTTHRFSATVGGNLCLDTRCKFYNQGEWWRKANQYCLKYKGSICHVAPKGSICRATYSGDLAPALLIHGARVELISAEGVRSIALADMYQEDGANSLTLKPGELLVSVTIPALKGYKTVYHKTRVRGGVDYPLVGVAMATSGSKTELNDIRIALTGTNSRPLLISGTDILTGKPLDEGSLKALRKLVFSQVMPMQSTFSPSAYRRKVVVNITRRLILDLLE